MVSEIITTSDRIDALDYVRAAELQNTKAGARIGMNALANPDRYGIEKAKEMICRVLDCRQDSNYLGTSYTTFNV